MFGSTSIVILFCSIINVILPLGINSLCPAKSTLITFDDITNTTSDDEVPVPYNYNGLYWNNFEVVNGLTPDSIFRRGVVSSPYVVFDPFGRSMFFNSTNGRTFTIHSFYSFAVWSYDVDLTITGTGPNNVSFTKTIRLSDENATMIELNWSAIDNVSFSPYCFTCCDAKHFTMDNLCMTF